MNDTNILFKALRDELEAHAQYLGLGKDGLYVNGSMIFSLQVFIDVCIRRHPELFLEFKEHIDQELRFYGSLYPQPPVDEPVTLAAE